MNILAITSPQSGVGYHRIIMPVVHMKKDYAMITDTLAPETFEKKIEKVKELLVYDELSLSEIAFRLNYSSVAYLSNQFKKVTGFSPSHFKKIREDRRKPLDEV